MLSFNLPQAKKLGKETKTKPKILLHQGRYVERHYHFICWQDAIPLADAPVPTVTTAHNEQIFCYFGLPEKIHSDLGKQFQSRLIVELCSLWRVDQTHTTLYHHQSNGVVKRGNRVLGDALRAFLLDKGQEEWNLVLPQLLHAFRGTPQASTS